MLTLENAQASIAAGLVRAAEIETVPLAQAFARYVAEAVCARVDNPAFDNSAMDGYAVDTGQLVDAGFRLPLEGEASAGDVPAPLMPGTTMRIFTGAPVPDGADAVVIQEDIKRDNGAIIFPHTVQPGQNIRIRGEDFQSGEELFQRGHRLNAYDVALLSAAGVAEVGVLRRPKALVFATGDELATPGMPLQPGQIYESNRLATLLQLAGLGADVVDGGTVRDDPDAVREVLRSATGYDFVISSGGVSVGDYDLVKQVFAEIGDIDFWKVRIKPGKPVAFGHLGARTNFFGLPGNPVSSLVTFRLFVQPALAAWHHASHEPLAIRVRTTALFHRHAGRTEFLRARLHREANELVVTPLKGQGSHMIGTLKDSNALIRVAQDSEGFEPGDTVTVLPFDTDVA